MKGDFRSELVANKSIHILSAKGFANEAKDPSQVFALVAKE